jgi:RNA polymerase sigma-70 factor (ECF subfamily)
VTPEPAPSRSKEQRLIAWANKHLDALMGYALIRVRSQETAEELVQETFLAAIRDHKRFQGQSSELTWLTGILRHKIADHFRQMARHRHREDTDEKVDKRFDRHDHWSPKPAAWQGDPAMLAENQEFWDTLKQCLSALPEPLAHAFILREMEQQDSQDVCKNLAIEPANLWTRLHRARLRLRDCLEINWFAKDKEH